MELLYLWVEEYNNIEKQGFNFSSKYKFDFDYEKKELKCEENTNNVGEGFFGDNITNITAIIGKNGSGKSSVLELLKGIINSEKGINIKCILGFKNQLNNKVSIYSSIELKNYDDLEKIYKINDKKRIEMYQAANIGYPRAEELSSINGIFYSNIFDYKNEIQNAIEKNLLVNISSNYLLNDYHSNYRPIKQHKEETIEVLKKINKINERIEEDSEKVKIFIDEELQKKITNVLNREQIMPDLDTKLIGIYRMRELQKQIKFFSKTKSSIFSYINVPKSIIMDLGSPFIINSNYYKNLEEVQKYFDEKLISYLDNYEEKNENEIDKKLRFDIIFINSVLYYIFENIINRSIKTKEIIEEIKTIYKIEYSSDKCYIFINNVIKIIESKIENVKKQIDLIKEIIKIVKETSEDEIIINGNDAYLVKKIKENKELESLDLIIENLISLPEDNRVFTFSWDREISSGEKALITLFARIYDIISKLEKEKTNLIILDEPDIYMHPEWQRKLLQELINFIKYYFKDQNVQIILTSHSPFVISDLPKENVIFLDKDDDGMCKVVENSEKKKTFGANIHTLLSDGFFMESTLGEFARSKISWVMEILDKDIEEIRKEEEKIRTIINMIGEPIIKNKLMKMLEDKLNLSLINVGEIVEKSERKVKGMQARLNEQDKMIKELYSRLKKLENKGDKDDKN